MILAQVALEPTITGALVSAFGGIIVALLGLLAEGMRRNHNALRAVKKDTRASREQIQNSHSTNLRDDIDGLIEKVESVADAASQLVEGHGRLMRGQDLLSTHVNQLRDEQHQSRVDQAQERAERLAADVRIDQHIATVAITAAQVAEALRSRERHLDHNPEHNL